MLGGEGSAESTVAVRTVAGSFFPTRHKKKHGAAKERKTTKRGKKISETMKQRRVVDKQLSVSHRRGVGRVYGGVCVCGSKEKFYLLLL